MKRITRAEAKRKMWAYYKENKKSLPKAIRDYREEIIERLTNGLDVSEAFSVCS